MKSTIFSVTKATLALFVSPSVSTFVTLFENQESSRHQDQLQSSINFIHQLTLITIHLFNFSSPLLQLLRLLVLFIFKSNSTITNGHLAISLSSFIFHPSFFNLHPSSLILHFATFKLFSYFNSILYLLRVMSIIFDMILLYS